MASHGVPPPQIMSSLGRRPLEFDAAVIVSSVLFHAWGASVAVRRILRRGSGAVLTVYVSLPCSASGVLLLEQWAGIMENLRVGNGHLSYRVDRIPRAAIVSNRSLAAYCCSGASPPVAAT